MKIAFSGVSVIKHIVEIRAIRRARAAHKDLNVAYLFQYILN